ncbi:TPA: hypothetical protein DCZ31_03005 [Patescibacteria group bacterium]|nr:hypothetical protein [Candidatus Gracilibacteria bacterium]
MISGLSTQIQSTLHHLICIKPTSLTVPYKLCHNKFIHIQIFSNSPLVFSNISTNSNQEIL